MYGEPTSSLQEDQLKSHQSHLESLIGHLEGIFFFFFLQLLSFPQPFLIFELLLSHLLLSHSPALSD